MSDLHRAYEKNNIKLIKLLIEKGANINDTDKYDNTILHKACKENNVELIKFLIKKGANINCKNEDDDTSLHIVCENNNEELIKLLIDNGAKLNEKNKFNETCSGLLWDNGHKDIIESYYNAFQIIYNDNRYEIFNPYLITKTGSIIDVYESKIIEPIINDSYLQVKLDKKFDNKFDLIHILVANTYKPNEDKTLIIKHIDNNILNNNVNNLEWVKNELDLSHTEYICTIEFSEIPQFLYNSELYNNLESSDNFEILKKYYKNDLIIYSINDFFHILYTLRYWCIEKIPYEIYDYVLANKIIIKKYYKLLKDIFYDFFFINEFRILLKYKRKNIVDICAEEGFLNLLKYAHENGYPWTEKTCYIASRDGYLSCLKYAHENGCPWDVKTCYLASLNGHLDCLKYAHENGCPWNKITCEYAVIDGHLDCLKYAHENGCPLYSEIYDDASWRGHLDILIYCHENVGEWDKKTCYNASKNGHLDCLKYAHENCCPWDKEECLELARAYNHLECVKYIEDN